MVQSSDTLWNLRPLECDSNDTWMMGSHHMGACVLSHNKLTCSQFSLLLDSLYTVIGYDPGTAGETLASSRLGSLGFKPGLCQVFPDFLQIA